MNHKLLRKLLKLLANKHAFVLIFGKKHTINKYPKLHKLLAIQ